MGIQRAYHSESKMMYLHFSGDLNDQNFMEHIEQYNSEIDSITEFVELADLRQLKSMSYLTVEGTVKAALAGHSKPRCKLGILINDSAFFYGMARVFKSFADERRSEVRIFKDIDDALGWLIPGNDGIQEITDFIERVIAGN